MTTHYNQLANLSSRLGSTTLPILITLLSIIFCAQPLQANSIDLIDGKSRAWKQNNVASLATADVHSPLYKESHALLIGASNYQTWPQLSSIPSELDEVQSTLEAQNFEVERLIDPDSQELKMGIEHFIREYGYDSENRLLIFFSGHGHSMNEKGFILPVDTPMPEDRKAFRRTALPMTQVVAWARDIESKHVLFLFDSCFSGSIFTNKSMASASERYVRKAVSPPVRQFITAGGEDQQVPRFVNQTPQYGKIRDYSLSKGDFVFTPEKKPTAVKVVNNEQHGNANVAKRSIYNQEMGFELELELWRSAKQFGGEEDFKEYLQQYPNGKFAGIARNRLRLKEGLAEDAPRFESVPSVKAAPRVEVAPRIEREKPWQSVPRRKSTVQSVTPVDEKGLIEDDEDWQLVPGGTLNSQTVIPANVLVTPVGGWTQ